MTLQTVFNGMGGIGPFIGFIFYGLVVIAALTSSVAILEAIAGSFIDDAMNKGKGDKRKFYCWFFGILSAVLGSMIAYDGLGQNLPLNNGRRVLLGRRFRPSGGRHHDAAGFPVRHLLLRLD